MIVKKEWSDLIFTNHSLYCRQGMVNK